MPVVISLKTSPTLAAFGRAWRRLRIEHRLIRLDAMEIQIEKDLVHERQWLERMEINSLIQKRVIRRERRKLTDQLTKGEF